MVAYLNSVREKIRGIAWRIENGIVDELRKLHKNYDDLDNEILDQVVKDLADEAEELDFIGEIFANSTDKEGK